MPNLKFLIKPLLLVMALVTVFVFVFEFPQIKRFLVRTKVANRVFEIKGIPEGGGGTGFQIEAPSGNTYIVTNSHVCELAQKAGKDKNFLIVRRDSEHWMKRRILEVSGESDLCLVEAWPNLSGLKLGSELFVGEEVSAVGHPNLDPITMTTGEAIAYTKTFITHHYMVSGDAKLDKIFRATEEPCDQPKNLIVRKEVKLLNIIPLGEAKICMVKESNSIQTSVVIYPGSSGSPLIDEWGKVVGVIYAQDLDTKWGYAVNLEHLKNLLKDF